MKTPQPQPGILDISPYIGGTSTLKGTAKPIKLSSNEGPFGPPPAAIEAAQRAAEKMHRYPDGDCRELRDALAKTNGIEADKIVCGEGSDEILHLLCQAYAGAGDEVLYSEHGFLVYPIVAKAAGATPVVAKESNHTTDVDALLAAISDKTRIVFIANPNNPTGTWLDGRELTRLADGLRDDILLVIDSAYAEFVEDANYDAGIQLARTRNNVIMTRTFSKIYGLGGLRLGWAYGAANIIDVLNRVRGPFNVSSVAQAAGLAALGAHDFIERAREHNTEWRTWTTSELQAIGLNVTPSVCNFVLAHFPETDGRRAVNADNFLRENGIIVRRMEAYGFPNSLRITIGLQDEMRALVDALKKFMD